MYMYVVFQSLLFAVSDCPLNSTMESFQWSPNASEYGVLCITLYFSSPFTLIIMMMVVFFFSVALFKHSL